MNARSRHKVIIQLSEDQFSQPEAIHVPSLGYHLDFTNLENANELTLFQTLKEGYLENKLTEVVKAKKEKGEKIEDASMLALMTLGYSELTASSHSYTLYFVKDIKKINPANMDGISIIVTGEGLEREAFLVADNKFHYATKGKSCCSRKKLWSLKIVIDQSQLELLEKTEYNPLGMPKPTIHNYQFLKKIEKTVVKKAGWLYIPYFYTRDIFVVDCEPRPCHFFTRVAPPFIQLTMLARFGVSALFNLGMMDSMPNPLFPPVEHHVFNSTTGNSTTWFARHPGLRTFNVVQTLMGFSMMLFFIFMGVRTRTLSGLGLQIDDMFISLYRKLFAKKSEGSQKNQQEWTWLDIKIATAKGFFYLLILYQMFIMSLWSYLRISTLSETIANQKDSMFSPWFIKDLSITEWFLELMNEPSLLLSEGVLMSYLMDLFFRKSNTVMHAQANTVSEEKVSEMIELLETGLSTPLLTVTPENESKRAKALIHAAYFFSTNPRRQKTQNKKIKYNKPII